MKHKKICIFFISMLMTISTIAGAMNTNYKQPDCKITSLINNDAELPVWKVNDFWEYKIDVEGFFYGFDMDFDVTMPDLKFKVLSTSGSNYKLSIAGSITGSGTYSLGDIDISGSLSSTSISGTLYVGKADLAIVNAENIHISGKIATIFNINVDIDTASLEVPLSNLVFPMNIGDSWTVPLINITLLGDINQPAIVAAPLDMELTVREHNMQCSKFETKNGYNSLKVAGSPLNYWYSPEAGNIVWAEKSGTLRLYLYNYDDYYYELTNFAVQLKDTNYVPPNEPPTSPNKPSGETNGRAGVNYEYCTSGGNDPEGKSVKYGFDWNDDNSVDDWTGLVNSGQEACMSHKFSNAGTYHIKAKTKDETGAESGWSSELAVTMAPNNPPGIPNTPSGETTGMVGDTFTYTTNSVSDPDGDDVTYIFNWGDGSTTNSDTASASHSWSSKGTFDVKARSKDSFGAKSDWSGTLSVYMDNNAPGTPVAPTGPPSGKEDTSYAYNAVTTDPDGHKVYYMFDWGDGTDSGWKGPYNSGQTGEASHDWTEGNYEIRVKAKDEYGMETDWSDPLPITMPRSKSFSAVSNLLARLLENFPLIQQLLLKS